MQLRLRCCGPWGRWCGEPLLSSRCGEPSKCPWATDDHEQRLGGAAEPEDSGNRALGFAGSLKGERRPCVERLREPRVPSGGPLGAVGEHDVSWLRQVGRGGLADGRGGRGLPECCGCTRAAAGGGR